MVNAYSSSINSYPSVLLRGKFKSNLEYTKLNSKTRIGSFGIKGWVSGKLFIYLLYFLFYYNYPPYNNILIKMMK